MINDYKKKTNETHVNLFTASYNIKKDNKVREWTFASRRENPLCDGKAIEPDCVVVVPFFYEGEKKKIIFVSQFRPPLGRVEFDFPAGKIDSGEIAEYAAHRELEEETGYSILEFTDKSPVLCSSAGLTDETFKIFFVRVDKKPSEMKQDDSEDITVHVKSVEEIVEMFESMECVSGKFWIVVNMLQKLGD